MNKKQAQDMLIKGGIEPNEAAGEIRFILEEIFNKTLEELIFLDEFDETKILPILNERIKTRRPVQYILKSAYFAGRKFYVDENVLIPRDETEILVSETIKHVKTCSNILDIGTGSGIIALSIGILARKKNVKILGVDISTDAINVALKNMKKYSMQGICLFRKSDIFSSIRKDEKFDIIVSNPPYIPKKLQNTLQKEVLFEPYNALFTEDEKGIYFYEKIIKDAKKYLTKKGVLLFELMEGQSAFVKEILLENGFSDISIIKDLSGIDRVIKGSI